MPLSFAPRPYAGEQDLAPLCALINANYVQDWPNKSLAVEDVRRYWVTRPRANPAQDLYLWEDADGHLVGAGLLRLRPPGAALSSALFDWFIHPTVRRQGLEEAVHNWGAGRLAEIARVRGQAAHLECRTWVGAAYRHSVLDVQGYRAVRYRFSMARALAGALPEPSWPAGYTVRAVGRPEDLGAWVELYNDAYAANWGFRPWTVDEHRHWLSASAYRADGDLVAVAPDGTLVAFCLCWIDPAANARHGRAEGRIALLGTRREYRYQGLGRALLLAGLRWLQAAGATTALLTLDVANPPGPLRLAESVGFVQADGLVIYQRDI